jgi:hypothetical protein
MGRRRSAPKSSVAKAPRTTARAEELAREAIAREEHLPGGQVRLTLRVVLPEAIAEELAARAIRAEQNMVTVVEEILSAAARDKP